MIKYLDDEITSRVTGLTVNQDCTVPYEIRNLSGSTILFAGNMFVKSGTTSVYVRMNDILEALKGNGSELDVDGGLTSYTWNKQFGRYYAVVSGKTGSNADVALVYKYPNWNSNMGNLDDLSYSAERYRNCLQGVVALMYPPKLIPRYPNIATYKYPIAFKFQIQTNNASGNVYLPLYIDGKYTSDCTNYLMQEWCTTVLDSLGNYVISETTPRRAAFSLGDLYGWSQYSSGIYYTIDTSNRYALDIENAYGDILKTFTLSTTPKKYELKFNCNDVGGKVVFDFFGAIMDFYDDDDDWYDKYLTLSFTAYRDSATQGARIWISNVDIWWGTSGQTDTYIYLGDNIIGQLDTECMSKYYLMWQDRYGGYQSQRFDKVYTYSEDFTKQYISNYQREKRVSNVTVNPKLEIQTDWLDEELYPYYESIFVSPYLILYDTEEDICYNVNVTDNTYTEKTIENQQRKLFNLKLKLERNKTQIVKY